MRGSNLDFLTKFSKKISLTTTSDGRRGSGKAADGRILGWDGFSDGFLKEKGKSLERRERVRLKEREKGLKKGLLAYIVHLKRRHFGRLNSPRYVRLASGSPDPIALDPDLLTVDLVLADQVDFDPFVHLSCISHILDLFTLFFYVIFILFLFSFILFVNY